MSDEKLNDSLLEVIGRLQGRNQSLTKGHATLTRRVNELEAALETEKQRGTALQTPRGMECYDSKGFLRVQMGTIPAAKLAAGGSAATRLKTDKLAAEPDTATLLNADECSIGSPSEMADAHLQADIEYLRQRVSTLEEAHRWAFGAGKGTSDDMAVFQETVNRGIDQALRRAIEPGGILYGLKK